MAEQVQRQVVRPVKVVEDQQDAADLEVPVVPIYIQEKIHPRALIEDLKRGFTALRDCKRVAAAD